MKLFNRKTQDELVLEIHNEFDTAQDRLLQEANDFMAFLNVQSETDIERKAEQLKRLGFVNSEVVKKAETITTERAKTQQKIVESQEQAELIQYYKFNYPFQKFLTESELERICNKYNLVFASVDRYKKDVPQKNLDEISNATQLKEKDIEEDVYTINLKYPSQFDTKRCLEILGKTEFSFTKREIYNLHCQFIDYWSGRLIDEWNFGSKSDYMILYDFCKHHKLGSLSTFTYTKTDKSGLFICAPQSHFDLDGLKKTKSGFFKILETEVKDPIVFRYCRGGIQVLSKWGLEADDELLYNEFEN